MDLHDYRDIAKIYNEKTFKKQLVLQGIFTSFIVLSIPIVGLLMNIFRMNHYFFSILMSLAFIVWISVMSFQEKKETFIPAKYFSYIRYRVCYLLVFFILNIKIGSIDNPILPLLIIALLYIPIEIYSGYKEFVTFKMKMVGSQQN